MKIIPVSRHGKKLHRLENILIARRIQKKGADKLWHHHAGAVPFQLLIIEE